MQPIPLLSTSAIRPLLEYAAAHGVAVRFARDVRPQPWDPSSPLIPASLAGRLFEAVARVSGDDAIGLRLGAAVPIESLGDLGGLLAGAATIGAALETVAAQAARLHSGQRIWLHRHGSDAWLHHHWPRALRAGRRQAGDYALMLAIGLVARAAGADWRPNELHLEGERPRHAARLEALATQRVLFGQPHDVMVFPRRILALPMPRASRAAAADPPAPGAPPPALEFVDSLRHTVAALLQMGTPELPAAAEAAGLSVRSFQRRLAAVDLSFGELVDAARFAAARRMLCDPAVKVVEVSAELGYSDSANFTRAFRRWAGVPPREFRRQAALSGPGGRTPGWTGR